MSLLRSKASRVFYSANGVLSDRTEDLRTWGTPNWAYTWNAVQDALYIGRSHAFSYLYLAVTTANATPSTLSVAYWDGSTWNNMTDLLDETGGLASSGFLTWEQLPKWQKKKPADVSGLASLTSQEGMYWVKITLSGNGSGTLRALKDVLSDDRYLQVIHPEILNYLPASKTDFLEQHELARDEIIQAAIANGTIKYAAQIKNPEDWFLSASHKCIEVILRPITGDDKVAAVRDSSAKASRDLLPGPAASLDVNENEVLDDSEVEPGFMGSVLVERR